MDKEKTQRSQRRDQTDKLPIYCEITTCASYDALATQNNELQVGDLLEICIVISGSGVHKILGQLIPCRKGDVFIVPKGIPHGYFLSDESDGMEMKRLFFEPMDWFGGEIALQSSPRYCYGAFHNNAAVSYARLNFQTFSDVELLCERIAEETRVRKKEWQDAVHANLTLLLIIYGRYVSDAIQNDSEIRQSDWHLVSPVIAMIAERHADRKLTLEAIADMLHVSQSHLSRIFGKVMGESFSQYLRNVRLDHACELLKDTVLTVDEIVESCGLRDVPSFYQSFHAYTGLTPNQYRIANKKTHINGEKIMVILSDISENLQKGKGKIVKELVENAIAEGADAEQILNEGLLAGMSVIGEKFKSNEIYVPEVLIAARAMNMGAQVLKPHLAASGVKASGKVCIGTVQGDLHDIGKNLVRMMMEGKGLEVIDLGTDVSPETFIKTAIEENCQVICCSALLTTTMPVMEEVVREAEKAGIRDKVKIMVGGAPINEDYCKRIGADCYAPDAASAADAAAEFCKA